MQWKEGSSDTYIRMLTELRKCFRWVWPHKNPTEILLQYDSAKPHTSVKAWEAITKFCWTVLLHLPYSTNLALLDFHLCGGLKYVVHAMKFETWWWWWWWWWCVLHSENMTTWAGQGMVLMAHTCSLAQGHRSGWRLCGNVVYEIIWSLFILYDFMI
jgi:hypothetical protein